MIVINNNNFYPTPEWVAKKMIEGLNLNFIKSVLEPSAGNGNLVRALVNKQEKENQSYRYSRDIELNIDCIEMDLGLQAILRSQGFKVVSDDFLSFDTVKNYDLILMNPPFDCGAKHLLKAIELQERNGGSIVCLLNAETLKKPCSNDRKTLLRYLDEHEAEITFIEDGFKDAERKTNVETAMIKMKIPQKEHHSILLGELKKKNSYADWKEETGSDLIEGDFIKGIVNQYELESRLGASLIREYQSMQKYLLASFDQDNLYNKDRKILNLYVGETERYSKREVSVNEYIQELRYKYWSALFNNQQFVGKLTNDLANAYRNKVAELKDYDFSLFNIYALQQEMQSEVLDGIEAEILKLFEELSNKYHWYNECSANIHYYNGWKTNKSYVINKKVIIPLDAFSSFDRKFDPVYKVGAKLRDIEKCLSYLSYGVEKTSAVENILMTAKEGNCTRNIEMKYFTVTFYKKGTCHITFKDEELLKKFNLFGSQKRGWLPPDYGKKHYDAMTPEEQEVVNAFDGGKGNYERIMARADYYIYKSVNLLEKIS